MRNLAPIIDHLNRTRAELERALAAVPEPQWRTVPNLPRGGWSVAEVVAHLVMVEKAITDGAVKMVSREPRPVPFWKRRPVPLSIVSWRGLKRKTPIPLDPALLDSSEAMLARLGGERQRTLGFLDAQRERDLSKFFSSHPFFGPLNGYQWFWVMGYHEARHTKQIHEIVDSFHN